jgi:hypothetical protein
MRMGVRAAVAVLAAAAAIPVAVTAAAAAAPAGGAGSAGTVGTAADGCYLFAEVPTQDDQRMWADGGQSGCDWSRSVTVELKKYRRWWPDKVLSRQSAAGDYVRLMPGTRCSGHGSIRIYTRVTAGGEAAESRKVSTTGCSD